jgi:photosystem II stability/assembly factor-like uncharacterized protein
MTTVDGGAHWQTQAAERTAGHRWVTVRAIDASHAFAASDDGIVLATEDGEIWNTRANEPGCSLRAIAFADATHGWVVGSDTAGHSLILATADRGATWSEVEGLAPVPLTTVDFADALHGWAAGPGALLRTTDGGTTWRSAAWPLPADATPTAVALDFSSATHGWLAITSGGTATIWETLDGGAAWRLSELPGSATAVTGIAALNDLHALAFGACLPSSSVLTAGSIWSLPAASAGSPGNAPSATANRRTGEPAYKAHPKRHPKRHARKRHHR